MGDYDIHPDEQMPHRDRVGRWADKAACAGQTSTMYGSDDRAERYVHSDSEAYAVAICLTCPVKYECRKHAIDNDERWGVWGGLTPRERRPYTRQLRNCSSCGDTFSTRSPSTRTCSSECRAAATAAARRRCEQRRRQGVA